MIKFIINLIKTITGSHDLKIEKEAINRINRAKNALEKDKWEQASALKQLMNFIQIKSTGDCYPFPEKYTEEKNKLKALIARNLLNQGGLLLSTLKLILIIDGFEEEAVKQILEHDEQLPYQISHNIIWEYPVSLDLKKIALKQMFDNPKVINYISFISGLNFNIRSSSNENQEILDDIFQEIVNFLKSNTFSTEILFHLYMALSHTNNLLDDMKKIKNDFRKQLINRGIKLSITRCFWYLYRRTESALGYYPIITDSSGEKFIFNGKLNEDWLGHLLEKTVLLQGESIIKNLDQLHFT